MIDYLYTQEKVKDALREADRQRMIKIATGSRKAHNRQRFARLAYRLKLTHAG